MNVSEAIFKRRSIRRFSPQPVDKDVLYELVQAARMAPAAANIQPLQYMIVHQKQLLDPVFDCTLWAGYLEDWDGPIPEERPVAYIIQCLDSRHGQNCLCCDGIQLEAITLGATALGLGGCIIKSFKAQKLSESLNLPKGMIPRYVLALGHPVEEVQIVDMNGLPDADFKYYRDINGKHYVPKRPLEELIIK